MASTLCPQHDTRLSSLITCIVMVCTILACILPMSLLPSWNGEVDNWKNQYELMADNILAGRITFDYGYEDQLLALENPYDPQERLDTGVTFAWDHAYYDNEYYMYFGIVPVFLVYLPYRILTGMQLTGYHGTQVFAAVAIMGIFALFHLLRKLLFRSMPQYLYLTLAVAFSAISFWYSSAEPSLYCTAITAAIALELWSLYCFTRAVWYETEENKQIALAGVGALLGALTFGCRPPIGFANIVVLPMLIVFLKQRKITFQLIKKLALAASPYLIVAILLMTYNYLRFDNPFEFGQKYQLTVEDQSNYSMQLSLATLRKIVEDGHYFLFVFTPLRSDFPFVFPSGVFFNFPFLFLIALMLKPAVWKKLAENKILSLVITIGVTCGVIIFMDCLWSPFIMERYRMDIYFLLCIACFLILGTLYHISSPKARRCLAIALVVLSVITVITSVLMGLERTRYEYPELIAEMGQSLFG